MRESSILFVMGEAAIDLAVVGKDFERAAMNFPCTFVAITSLADLTAWEESDDLCLAECGVEGVSEFLCVRHTMTTRSQYAKPTEEGPPGRRST